MGTKTNTRQKMWQSNYYDIIKNEDDYHRIYEYIENNHLKWEIDSLHPCNNEKKEKS
jgi:putative transposase